jgi:lactoylglutathione lyase
MLNQIGLITIITDKLDKMKDFYTRVLSFECIEDLGTYVEFRNKGVRFALTTNKVMYDATKHQIYMEKRQGLQFELAIPLPDPDSVILAYDEIIEKGAIPVSPPEMMPWERMTAFFADPDGNIHELYSLKPREEV